MKSYVGRYEDLSVYFKYQSYKKRKEIVEMVKSKTKDNIENNILTNDNYYVYCYMHPGIKGPFVYSSYIFEYCPFYIGKGKYVEDTNYERHFSHLYYNNKKIKSIKHHTIERIKQEYNRLPMIVKILENVDEQTAFDVENYLISKIGRIENQTGILTNKQRGHKTDWDKVYEKI